MSEKFRPCPFWGSNAIKTRSRSGGETWQVVCLGDSPADPKNRYCGATITGDSIHEAIALWNKRVDSGPLMDPASNEGNDQ